MEHIPFDAELHSPLCALGDGLNAVQPDAMQSRLVLLLGGDKAALAGDDGGRIARILAVDVKHVPRAGEGQVDGRIARTVWHALNALDGVVEQVADDGTEVGCREGQLRQRIRGILKRDPLLSHEPALGGQQRVHARSCR